MAEPYLGQIEMFGFSFAPKNWALCNGQLMSIAQNQTLFSLLGTVYGGDGITTFKLPELRGRVPLGFNGAHPLGQSAGEPAHTLSSAEIPAHQHFLRADGVTTTGITNTPANNLSLGRSSGVDNTGKAFNLTIYSTGTGGTALAPGALGPGGGNAAHDNMMPYTVVNFCISLAGIYPSQN
jgi:microcystin-dependent protein